MRLKIKYLILPIQLLLLLLLPLKKKFFFITITSITNLVTAAALTAVGNKIPEHSKYVITSEFNGLTAENITARLAQANLASKNDIDNFVKMTDFDDKLKDLKEKNYFK